MSTRILILTIIAVLLITTAFGQPGGGGPPGGGEPVPLSGIEILVAIGGLLGVKRIFDRRKK